MSPAPKATRARRARLTLYLDPLLDGQLRRDAARNRLTIGRYVTRILQRRLKEPIRGSEQAMVVALEMAEQRFTRAGSRPSSIARTTAPSTAGPGRT
jgi:hypothetical protein